MKERMQEVHQMRDRAMASHHTIPFAIKEDWEQLGVGEYVQRVLAAKSKRKGKKQTELASKTKRYLLIPSSSSPPTEVLEEMEMEGTEERQKELRIQRLLLELDRYERKLPRIGPTNQCSSLPALLSPSDHQRQSKLYQFNPPGTVVWDPTSPSIRGLFFNSSYPLFSYTSLSSLSLLSLS